MKVSEKTKYLLTLLEYNGIGKNKARQIAEEVLLSNDDSPKIIELLLEKLIGIDKQAESAEAKNTYTADEFQNKYEKVDNQLNNLSNAIDGVVSFLDEAFPEGIVWSQKNSNKKPAIVKDAPIFLCYKGDFSILDPLTSIAVIGTREPSENAIIADKLITKELVKKGFTIISGLAKGCDEIAHRQVVESKGKGVIILASDLSDINPKTNIPLANEILNNKGLIISEYLFSHNNQQEYKARLVERDRLQALFSSAVIAIAGNEESGTRHAMGKAKDYGVPRAVVWYSNEKESNWSLNRKIYEEAAPSDKVAKIDGKVKICLEERLYPLITDYKIESNLRVKQNKTVVENLDPPDPQLIIDFEGGVSSDAQRNNI